MLVQPGGVSRPPKRGTPKLIFLLKKSQQLWDENDATKMGRKVVMTKEASDGPG